MGIRLALGADRAQLMAHIVKHGLVLTCAGIALGLVGAFGVAPSVVMTSTASGGDDDIRRGRGLIASGVARVAREPEHRVTG